MGRPRGRPTASQKTGPELVRCSPGWGEAGRLVSGWFPIPCPGYLHSCRRFRVAAFFPDWFFKYRCLKPRAFFRRGFGMRLTCSAPRMGRWHSKQHAASNTQYRADGNGRNVPEAETMQQVPVQQRSRVKREWGARPEPPQFPDCPRNGRRVHARPSATVSRTREGATRDGPGIVRSQARRPART